VTAAASVPSSFTSKNVSCMTYDMYIGVSLIPWKSALLLEKESGISLLKNIFLNKKLK